MPGWMKTWWDRAARTGASTGFIDPPTRGRRRRKGRSMMAADRIARDTSHRVGGRSDARRTSAVPELAEGLTGVNGSRTHRGFLAFWAGRWQSHRGLDCVG